MKDPRGDLHRSIQVMPWQYSNHQESLYRDVLIRAVCGGVTITAVKPSISRFISMKSFSIDRVHMQNVITLHTRDTRIEVLQKKNYFQLDIQDLASH